MLLLLVRVTRSSILTYVELPEGAMETGPPFICRVAPVGFTEFESANSTDTPGGLVDEFGVIVIDPLLVTTNAGMLPSGTVIVRSAGI
jgi:hypothetical protein